MHDTTLPTPKTWAAHTHRRPKVREPRNNFLFGDERKWFLPYYADMGAGESKFTWQVNAGVGYKFDWGSVFATYRYLD